ncbi:DUF3887 domain-containing protein [Phascolarctobacterium sp.]|uniref:DUF3887 domain-containing protein n=1 Tax=Phascolarctobacterium sp. TaxID=2049039 RepID=UPI00386FA822
MKKLLMLVVVSCLMMVCSVGLAANEHKDLAKQQQAVERMLDVFDGEPVPAYAQVSAGFSANMKKAVTEKVFADLQKQVRTKFGVMKEAKFFTYQRFGQADRVTYIASFSKEKLVSMIFAFDKQNKMIDLAFTPVQQPEVKK